MMTALQLNAEMYRALGAIADDEGLMLKALKYVKKLAAKREDETLMTKEEFFARVDEAREQIRRGECFKMFPDETVEEFLRRVG